VPPVFEENRGQVDGQARYILRGRNFNLFVTESGVVLTLRMGEARAAVRLEVAGAIGDGVVTGESPTGGQSTYFRGRDPAKWVTGVRQFGKVRVIGVRPGLDFVCYPNEKRLEYDLVVKPGSRVEDARVRFAGAERISLTPAGELKIETAAGELLQHRPRIWQESNAGRVEIAGRYRIVKGGNISVRSGTI
jgi:hypothetical protein